MKYVLCFSLLSLCACIKQEKDLFVLDTVSDKSMLCLMGHMVEYPDMRAGGCTDENGTEYVIMEVPETNVQ